MPIYVATFVRSKRGEWIWSYPDGDGDGEEGKNGGGKGEGGEGSGAEDAAFALALNDEVRFRVRTVDFTQVRRFLVYSGLFFAGSRE